MISLTSSLASLAVAATISTTEDLAVFAIGLVAGVIIAVAIRRDRYRAER